MHLCPRVNKQASTLFGLVYSDVWGPFPTMSLTGFKYFVTFVDDFSRVTWIYLMKSHYEIIFFLILVPFVMKFKLNFMSLFNDNAKEYLSEPF